MRLSDIAEHLGRSVLGIRRKMVRLGVYKTKKKTFSSRCHDEGTVMWYSNHGNRRYWRIKVNGKWMSYAKYLYIQEHGSIPEGMVITYKDKNRRNVDINNLVATPIEKIKKSKQKRKSFIDKILNNEI